MAPHRSSAHNSLSSNFNDASTVDAERDIWSSILKQVQQTATNKLPSNKSILLLGDNDSGKTSLVAKMQGIDTTCKGSGLEYHYLVVRDEYRDEQTQCGVWIADGNYQWKSHLLRFALNEENFQDTTVLFVCSMTKPWDIMNSLDSWSKCLEDHVKSLKLGDKKFKEYKDKCRRRFQDYISPGDEIEGLTSMRRTQSIGQNDDILTHSTESGDSEQRDQLPVDVLCNNLGLDIVVAITKTDYMSTLEKDFDYKEEHFDFVQQHIRKFCLKYGAALMYVSAKINKNCDLLYKYLVHRIYGIKFKTPALVVEKDAVFIPSGWDNEKKIAILYDNIQTFSPTEEYNDIIVKPSNVNTQTKEPEIAAEDDQIFWMKIRTQLSQQQSTGNVNAPRTSMGTSSPVSGAKSTDRRSTSSSTASPVGTTAATLLESTKNSPGGEGVLQTFFNSLLNRKSVGGSGVGTGGVAGSPRSNLGASSVESLRGRDVHAELDRIIEGTKQSSSSPVSNFGSNSANDGSNNNSS